VKGEYKVYTNPTPGNYSKYKNKEKYTHIIILNIKRDKNTHTQKEKNEREKNMKKNHINFAHPNKWSDSLASPVKSSPSVTTEIATG